MRLEHRASSDQSFPERGWRIAPPGEIIDQDGGMIAGDVFTRMASLTMRANGTDRFNKAPTFESNSGSDCERRWVEAKREQEEHARVFLARFKLPWEIGESE